MSNIEALDISVPILSPRFYRAYQNLSDLDTMVFEFQPVEYKDYSEQEQREIVFEDLVSKQETHITLLDKLGIANYHSVVAYFVQQLIKYLGLQYKQGSKPRGYDVLYGRIKRFIRDELFGKTVDLENTNTLRNLSALNAHKNIAETFKAAINALTVCEQNKLEIQDYIKLSQTQCFRPKSKKSFLAKYSVFNRIVIDNNFELAFAEFLESDTETIASYAKNHSAVGFKIPYIKHDGSLSNYIPDFFVKLESGKIVIVETKGQKDVDVDPKMKSLKRWCQDVNSLQANTTYDFLYVDEENFEKYLSQIKTFDDLMENFQQYKDTGDN